MVLAVAVVLQRHQQMPSMCCLIINLLFTVNASAARNTTVSACTASFVFHQETRSSVIYPQLAAEITAGMCTLAAGEEKFEDIYTELKLKLKLKPL